MANLAADLKNLMQDHGFILIRQNKHAIWRRGAGEQIVTSVSPSDWRAIRKVEAHVNRLNRARDGQETEVESREPRKTVITPTHKVPLSGPLTVKLGDLLPQSAAPGAPEPPRVEITADLMAQRLKGYPPEQKEAISLRLIELFEANVTYPEMARIMKLEGFRNLAGGDLTPGGLTLWARKELGLQRRAPPQMKPKGDPVAERLEKADEKPPAPKKEKLPVAPRPPAGNGGVPTQVRELMNDDSIPEGKRLKMLLAFME